MVLAIIIIMVVAVVGLVLWYRFTRDVNKKIPHYRQAIDKKLNGKHKR